MSNVIVARFRRKKDAEQVKKMIKKLGRDAEIIKGEKLEDLWLGKMIDEGMKEGGEVPIEAIHKKLRK